jgi:hypothetical protein
MQQLDLFGGGGVDAYGHALPVTAKARRDEAVARAGANAPEGWIEDAINAIRHVTLTKKTLTTDDVWPLVVTPPEPRAMGAAFQEAARRGVIRKTDRVQNSIRPECHSRPVAVWEVVQ